MNKLHQDDVRKKIQASQLINVLQDHALKGVGEMPPTRLKSIEILLRKSIPDLSAVTISGDGENPLKIENVLDVSNLSTEVLAQIIAAKDAANKG